MVKLVVPFAPAARSTRWRGWWRRTCRPSWARPWWWKTGAAPAAIGANAVAKAAPDGQTLLVATLGYVMSAGTTPHLPYDPRRT